MYLQRLIISPPSPVLANIHSILASESCCACLHDTHNYVGLPTQILFNGGPESQPIAGSMPVNNCVRRWLNTTPTLTERMIRLLS